MKEKLTPAGIPALVVLAALAVAALFGAGGVAVIAIKWFVSLITGGF
jgi:hypothetical protein